MIMRMLVNIMAWVAAFALIFSFGCDGKEAAQVPSVAVEQPDDRKVIVAVGDSLTEGLGVNDTDAYPAQLENKLAAAGYAYRVINAGISSETSSGTLSRINWILTLKPEIVILETGANDGLRGIDPALTEKNIDAIVRRLKENRVTVVLAGMQMVSNLGERFTTAFAKIYPSVAQQHQLTLIPFFLEGVAGVPSKNLPDGIHPTSEGYRIIVENLYPYVIEAIERVEDSDA